MSMELRGIRPLIHSASDDLGSFLAWPAQIKLEMSEANPLLDKVLENLAFSMHPIAGGDSFWTHSARELQIRNEGRQLGCLLVQRTKGETQLRVTKWLSATNGWEAWRQLNLSFLSRLLSSLLHVSFDDEQPASFLQPLLAWKELMVEHQELSDSSLNTLAIETCQKEQEELGEDNRVDYQANSLQQQQEQDRPDQLVEGGQEGTHSPQPPAQRGKGEQQLPNSAQRASKAKREESLDACVFRGHHSQSQLSARNSGQQMTHKLAARKGTRSSKSQVATGAESSTALHTVVSVGSPASFGGASLVALMVQLSVPSPLAKSELAYEESLKETEEALTNTSLLQPSPVPSLTLTSLKLESLVARMYSSLCFQISMLVASIVKRDRFQLWGFQLTRAQLCRPESAKTSLQQKELARAASTAEKSLQQKALAAAYALTEQLCFMAQSHEDELTADRACGNLCFSPTRARQSFQLTRAQLCRQQSPDKSLQQSELAAAYALMAQFPECSTRASLDQLDAFQDPGTAAATAFQDPGTATATAFQDPGTATAAGKLQVARDLRSPESIHYEPLPQTMQSYLALDVHNMYMDLRNVVQNNLAGKGPDPAGAEELRYENVFPNLTTGSVDLVVKAETSSHPKRPANNGVKGEVGSIGF